MMSSQIHSGTYDHQQTLHTLQLTNDEFTELRPDGVRQKLRLDTEKRVLPRDVAKLPRYHVDSKVIATLNK